MLKSSMLFFEQISILSCKSVFQRFIQMITYNETGTLRRSATAYSNVHQVMSHALASAFLHEA